MIRPPPRFRRICLLARLSVAVCCTSAPLHAGSVRFESVESTFHGGAEAELREAIDGADVGRHGWFVAPHTDRPQAAIFRPGRPVDAAAMEISLCFLAGRANSYFGDFTISATSDARPALDGHWKKLVPLRWSATGPEITLGEDGHLRAEGSAADAVLQIAVRADELPVTAFRVDVFPVRRGDGELPRMTARMDGDFLLTEFRVETATPHSTNIARDRPVRASHPARFAAEALTDGLPGTFSHPLLAGLGSAFFFEIDLGTARRLDHIALRNRGDGAQTDRLSRIALTLFEEPPDASAAPVWRGKDRADGTHPGAGEADVVRAGDGTGRFAGRWLRISSDSPVAFSPQLAEVEVYEELDLQPAEVRVDGVVISAAPPLRLAPGARWLSVTMKPRRAGLPEDLACRWRLRGYHADWQVAPALLAEGPCPSPGRYLFEAQVRHTDGEWDSAILAMPVEVRSYFWQTRLFRFWLGATAMLALVWLVRNLTRRRLARRMAVLEAKAALNEERARIARDMHDEVGARLSQLAIVQEIFAREHLLSEEARHGMRQLAENTRGVVASLDEVVWAVNPKNDTLPSLAGYLEQCATSYLGPVGITCRIDAPFDWPELEVRAQMRHHLVMAFRETLQNIVKHAAATEVTLRLRLEGEHLGLVLADNGRGITEQREAPGQDGLVNMRARLSAIGGTCEVRPRAGGGTEVELRIRLGHDFTTVDL